MKELRMKKQEDELGELRKVPHISKQSREIAEEMRLRENENGRNILERFEHNERDKNERFMRDYKNMKEKEMAGVTGKPKVLKFNSKRRLMSILRS